MRNKRLPSVDGRDVGGLDLRNILTNQLETGRCLSGRYYGALLRDRNEKASGINSRITSQDCVACGWSTSGLEHVTSKSK